MFKGAGGKFGGEKAPPCWGKGVSKAAGKGASKGGPSPWGPPAQGPAGWGLTPGMLQAMAQGMQGMMQPGKGAGLFAAPAPAAPEVPVLWIELSEPSRLTADGYPEVAPVILFEKGKDILSSSSYLISEFVGDVAAEVAFDHDPDWEVFPEVAKAIKDAGGEDNCFCVASCASQGKWAVGMAGNWKNRESAARLALSVAIAAHSPKLAQVCKTYPGFAALCGASGIAPAGGAAGAAVEPAPEEWGSKKKKKAVAAEDLFAGAEPAAPAGNATPIWLMLEEESRVTAEGFPPDAPALVYEKSQDVFKSGHHILQEIVGDISAEVQFTHDADWEVFPEVMRAIKKAGGEDNCLVVATCPSHAKWAVGLANGWKTRESAAKVALALAIGKDVPGTLETLSASYPEFAEMCHEQGLVSELPSKRRKTGGAMAGVPGTNGGPILPAMKGSVMGNGAAKGKTLPLEVPRWIEIGIEDSMPSSIDDLPREALVLNSNGTGKRGLYNCIDQVLSNFGLDPNGGTDIEFIDDPSWDVFPEIGKALKQVTDEEQALHVAICRALGVYGCGLSSKWKNRNAAAKVSLALLLVMRAGEGGEKPDLSDYPAFAKTMEEVPPAPFAA